MIVGIIGLGFVGDAIYNSFNNKHINLIVYDKYKNGGIGSLHDILKTDLVFLCLPTPFNDSTKKYDISSLSETLSSLSYNKYSGLIIIKSTVTPGTCQQFTSDFNLKIIHNPEFLTARTARHDFEHQQHIVLGKTSSILNSDIDIIQNFYKHYYPEAHISISESGESESMKIFVNSFYAVKIQIFNEFFLLAQKLNLNFNKIVEMMLLNGWINPMHTKVPGPDGNLSYGGACLPKDTCALLSMMQDLNIPSNVLNGCVTERNSLRSD